MKRQCYNINRPFHLARRDCFFEKGLALISKNVERKSDGKKSDDVAHIMYYLRSAHDHCVMAKKADNTASTEMYFLNFLQTIMSHLISLNAVAEFSPILGENGEDSGLRRFLESGAPENTRPAKEFCDCSQLIVDNIYKLCLLLERPFQDLKAETLSLLDDDQQRVYDNARKSLGEHLAARASHRSRMYAQTAYPVLEMKNG